MFRDTTQVSGSNHNTAEDVVWCRGGSRIWEKGLLRERGGAGVDFNSKTFKSRKRRQLRSELVPCVCVCGWVWGGVGGCGVCVWVGGGGRQTRLDLEFNFSGEMSAWGRKMSKIDANQGKGGKVIVMGRTGPESPGSLAPPLLWKVRSETRSRRRSRCIKPDKRRRGKPSRTSHVFPLDQRNCRGS